jgi:hypothetical protein
MLLRPPFQVENPNPNVWARALTDRPTATTIARRNLIRVFILVSLTHSYRLIFIQPIRLVNKALAVNLLSAA